MAMANALEGIGNILYRAHDPLIVNLLDRGGLADPSLDHRLNRVDLRGKDGVHIRLVSVIDEPDAEKGHGNKRHNQRDVENSIDSILEISPLMDL